MSQQKMWVRTPSFIEAREIARKLPLNGCLAPN